MGKKLVFLAPNIKVGGGIRVIIELANQMANSGCSVDIVYPNNSHDPHTFMLSDKVNTMKIGNLSNTNLRKLYNLLKTFEFVKKRKDSAIIITDPIMSIFGLVLRDLEVFRYIQAHDYIIFDDLKLLKSTFLLKIYKMLTKLSYKDKHIKYIFNSKFTFNSFLKISKRDDVTFNLVHPAVNHEIFCDMSIRKNDELNICLVARKHPCKGFVDFIRAWRELENGTSHQADNIYIISHDDLSEFDLSGFIVIKPKNDSEIAETYNKSHIFISTSWWEGFGLPPLEAMACGCAVILTDAGGVNEYAKANQNCLMYNPKSIDELREKMLLLINNPALRKKLRHNGLETAKEFSWKNSAKQLEEILR